MEARYVTRKNQLLAECQIAPEIFDQVMPRLHTFMEPFVDTLCGQALHPHARTYVCGLLSDVERKNVESIAYRFGQERLPLQRFIGWADWDDTPIRQALLHQVADHLGHDDGVLVFDPSAFAKSGTESVGVARQWCGRLGKVDNCQVALYLGYVSAKGHTLVDMRLYLPKEWTQDKTRLDKAGVPPAQRGYRTRHQLALAMLEKHGASLPHGWIAGDDEMGRPYWFRRRLASWGERYMLAVPSNTLMRDLETPVGAPPAAALATRRCVECSTYRWLLGADRRARRLQRAAGGRCGQTTRGGAYATTATRRRGAVSRAMLPRPRQPGGGAGRFLSVQRRAWDTAVAVCPRGQSRTSHRRMPPAQQE